MFLNREDAALRLAAKLKGRELRDPLVLAIPRGGLAIGSVLAHNLGAALDVVLARKLRAPGQPELAVGAVSESGEVYLNHFADELLEEQNGYLAEERDYQLDLIEKRKSLFRSVRPPEPITGRSVIVTDDGIATGSTMIAALKVVRAQAPHELIVAVPVASPDRLEQVRPHCDEVVCLVAPEFFWSIGQFYEDFAQVEDEEAIAFLLPFAPRTAKASSPTAGPPQLATHNR